MTENKSPSGVGLDARHCVDLGTWEDFDRELEKLRQNFSGQSDLPFLFRGQGNSSWNLETTLERSKKPMMSYREYYRLISTSRPEIESYTGNHWAIPEYKEIEELTKDYDQFSRSLTSGPRYAYDYMIYLRHHGFPSPLLDWTRSARIAAYFAFKNAVECENISIYVLSNRKITSGQNGMPNVHRLGQYVQAHKRHFLQQSDYTMCLIFNCRNEWKFSEHDNTLIPAAGCPPTSRNFDVWKFNIPSTERLKVLRILDEYNLNAHSLFGSEESLMETIALRKLHFQRASANPTPGIVL